MKTLKEKFESLTEDEKQEVIEIAKRLMKWDSFFVTMLEEEGEESTLKAAIGTATNGFLQQRFHEKFGERNLFERN